MSGDAPGSGLPSTNPEYGVHGSSLQDKSLIKKKVHTLEDHVIRTNCKKRSQEMMADCQQASTTYRKNIPQVISQPCPRFHSGARVWSGCSPS
jgi:hypothetical protein